MYVPKFHEERDIGVLHALIRTHPLGAWVVRGEDELVANHVPFLLDATRGSYGTLVGHIARANPVWRSLRDALPSVVLFQGAQAYVTPSWYPSKHAHGQAVPTWNYAVVHAHGVPRVIDDPEWLLEHVTQLTDAHESGRVLPWKVSDAPSGFIDRLLGAIVGIEIPVTKLVGKWKASQNRSEADRLGVVAGLLDAGDHASAAMAALVGRGIGS